MSFVIVRQRTANTKWLLLPCLSDGANATAQCDLTPRRCPTCRRRYQTLWRLVNRDGSTAKGIAVAEATADFSGSNCGASG
jgi:hypothetical protein